MRQFMKQIVFAYKLNFYKMLKKFFIFFYAENEMEKKQESKAKS